MSEQEFQFGKDKWADIADLVKRWHHRFPEESIQLRKDIQVARKEYNSDQAERPMRKGILINPSLMLYIQQFYPNFMDSNDDLRKFADKFPQFVVDDGVKSAKRKGKSNEIIIGNDN